MRTEVVREGSRDGDVGAEHVCLEAHQDFRSGPVEVPQGEGENEGLDPSKDGARAVHGVGAPEDRERDPEHEDARYVEEGDRPAHLTGHRDQRDPQHRHHDPHDRRDGSQPRLQGSLPGDREDQDQRERIDDPPHLYPPTRTSR